MTSGLQGKAAIITGAGAGIGRAAAFAFSQAGAKLLLVDINSGGVQETAAEVERAGGTAVAMAVDISDDAQVRAMVARAVEHYGRLDCAFNNAGIEGSPAPTADCTRDNWDRTLAVNLTGTWLCMKYELAQMLHQQPRGGAIVNTSSVAGLVGFPAIPAYVASKHAVLGLTKTAALDYALFDIRVNALCPGVIDTEMITRFTGNDPKQTQALTASEPVGRMGRPEEVAHAALWLCSESASFVTGHCMAVDGGFVAR